MHLFLLKNKYGQSDFYIVFINTPPMGYASVLLKIQTEGNTLFQIAKAEN